MKILHFSDPHFDLSLKSIPWKKWFGKRAVGALNLLGGRGKRFDDAESKIEALVEFKEQNGIDLVICTGDYTALGLEAEIINAAEIVAPLATPEDKFITVPGNHDIYLYDSLHQESFNRHFGKFMRSDLPQYRVDEFFPFVRLFDEVAVVGLNSAKPNPLPWRSTGYIPDKQLEAFSEILKDKRVKDKYILVSTHYAPRDENGLPDKKHHRLINAKEFLECCKGIEKGAILTGHIHKGFRVEIDGLKAPLFCAGSVTMDKRESFWLFEITKDSFKVSKGVFENGKYATISCKID